RWFKLLLFIVFLMPTFLRTSLLESFRTPWNADFTVFIHDQEDAAVRGETSIPTEGRALRLFFTTRRSNGFPFSLHSQRTLSRKKDGACDGFPSPSVLPHSCGGALYQFLSTYRC